MSKNIVVRPIDREEYALINGIPQYLYHRGASAENPVLLYLHGGPGNVESNLAHVYQEKMEERFTVVHWDQRGAGKTLLKNPGNLPDIDLLMQDLSEIIQYLKKKYHKEKIVLTGHSWGSIFGSAYILEHPEDISYYIGTGQAICLLENERASYEKLVESIRAAHDEKSLKKLRKLGEYPGSRLVFDDAFLKKCMKIRALQGKYGLAMDMGPKLWLAFMRSPIFRLSDLSALKNASKASRKILEFLQDFDLNAQSKHYKVPVYYILGAKDWQAPYPLAQKYFEEITAPRKKLFLLPDAGHMSMLDQPDAFAETFLKIAELEAHSEAEAPAACTQAE